VHHDRAVPEITAAELQELKQQSADVLIVDVRTPEEYGRFCIPGGINVPGGELILRAGAWKRRPGTPVIVNCAGRTRSIIGTAALRRLGLANVRALRNGTMGWVLAGYDLERQPRRTAPQPDIESRQSAVALALRIAEEEKLSWISPAEFSAFADAAGSMRYIIDVRSESEYASGHVAGSVNVPGGQAVQRADDFIAVRNAPIAFVSNEGARAVMAAYWYTRMGYPNVAVLRGGLRAWSAPGKSLETGARDPEALGFASARAGAQWIDPQALAEKSSNGSIAILDVGTSLEFESAHIPAACWISRGWIERRVPEIWPDRERPIVVTCPDGRHAALAAASLKEMGYRDVAVLSGGTRAWTAAGFPIAQGTEGCLVERNDVVLSPSVRGTKEDMQRYLDWELTLPKES
jgi:rhodanese-related sulfurtransferase